MIRLNVDYKDTRVFFLGGGKKKASCKSFHQVKTLCYKDAARTDWGYGIVP